MDFSFSHIEYTKINFKKEEATPTTAARCCTSVVAMIFVFQANIHAFETIYIFWIYAHQHQKQTKQQKYHSNCIMYSLISWHVRYKMRCLAIAIIMMEIAWATQRAHCTHTHTPNNNLIAYNSHINKVVIIYSRM